MNWAELFHRLDEWQDLAAGVLALFAALVGSAVVISQGRDGLRRRRMAARALSPLSLSALCEYAAACAGILVSIRAASDVIGEVALPAAPPVPVNVIPQLEKLIEASGRRQANAVADLVGKLQVQSTRLRGFVNELSSNQIRGGALKIRSTEYVLDAAEIYALSSRLFDYARRESSRVKLGKVTFLEMMTSLHLCGLHDEPLNDDVPGVRRRFINPKPTLQERWKAYPSIRSIFMR
jgi:hypothetical protein